MAISTALQENIVQRAAVTLREKAGLLQYVQKDATPDPGNLGASIAVGEHVYSDAGNVTPSSGNGPSTSEDSFTAKQVSLDTWKNGTVTVSSDDLAKNNLSATLQQGIDNAIASCVNAVSASINDLYTLIPYTVGVAGTTMFNNGTAASVDRLADVGAALDANDVPEMNRMGILSNAEAANYRKVPAVQNANQMGNDMVRISGMLGMDMGFGLVGDKRIQSHTVGTITTGLIAKAATAVAAGETSFVGTTAASTGACALKEGDVISIAHASGAKTYSLQADATQASAASDVTLTLDRGLEYALIGSEAVTIATGFGTGTQNIFGDLRGYGLFNRIPGAQLSGMTALRDPKVITDPVTGISILTGWYGQNARTVWEASILYGVNVVQSALLVRGQGV